MIKIVIQSMKCRGLKNILMLIQFTIGFTALLTGLGCINNVLQYKENVEHLASLDTIHIFLEENTELDNTDTMLSKYRNTFLEVQESNLADKLGLFESLEVYDFSGDYQQEFCLYELNADCLAMSKLSLQEGQMAPLENYNTKSGTIPIIVSSSMSTRYHMGQSYTLSYVNGENYKFEDIQVKVIGVLNPSQRFWRGGATWLSENIANSKDFILAPQFMNFQKDITYSMNSLLQLSGSEVEKEEKME